MDINQNIDNITKRLIEITDEAKRLQGALDVLQTLKGMGVKVVNPEKNLETVAEEEVLDEQPSTPAEEKTD
jgi:hypothetical protein